MKLKVKIIAFNRDKQNASCQNWNTSVKTRKTLVPIIDPKTTDNKYVPIIDDLRYNSFLV